MGENRRIYWWSVRVTSQGKQTMLIIGILSSVFSSRFPTLYKEEIYFPTNSENRLPEWKIGHNELTHYFFLSKHKTE